MYFFKDLLTSVCNASFSSSPWIVVSITNKSLTVPSIKDCYLETFVFLLLYEVVIVMVLEDC